MPPSARRGLRALLLVVAVASYAFVLARSAFSRLPSAHDDVISTVNTVSMAAPVPVLSQHPRVSSQHVEVKSVPQLKSRLESIQNIRGLSLERLKEEQAMARKAVLPVRSSPAPPLSHDEMVALLEERRQLVKDTCAARGLNQGDPNAWEFFVDRKHHLVWCNVFKAASSAWMYYFNILGGYTEKMLARTRAVPLTLARAKFPRPSVQELQAELRDGAFSFMVVREPFERLLSAYRNKIERHAHRFYRNMAKEIVAKYRPPGAKTSRLEAALPSPTFSEFVEFVTEPGRRPDEHWAPYHSFCTPCLVDFTVIAKLETFHRDQEYIISAANLSLLLPPSDHRRSPKVENRARGSASTASLAQAYFAQLSDAQIERLYRLYALDFEMFGYDYRKYFRKDKT